MKKGDVDLLIKDLLAKDLSEKTNILKNEKSEISSGKPTVLPSAPKNRNVRGTLPPTWIDELYQGARDYHVKKRYTGNKTS